MTERCRCQLPALESFDLVVAEHRPVRAPDQRARLIVGERGAESAGVTFVKGTDFDGGPDTLRLAYSFVSVDEIAEGVARLAAAIPVTA